VAPLDPNMPIRPAPAHAAGSAPKATPRRPTFTLLYEQHWRGVISALRCSGVPQWDLPDVAQDVFVRVHAALPRFDPARPVAPWLYTIAYRTAQDHLRSAQSRRMRLGRAEDEMETTDPAPSPERLTIIAEAECIFGEVLQQLNEDQRIAYLLEFRDGLTISEIAETLGENENTVRSRLHRARGTFDAALARRRTLEERRQSPVASFLAPMALANAVRTGADADPILRAAVWARLARVLGLGIIGKLAPLSGRAIVGAVAVVALAGGVTGALLHAGLERRARVEAIAREPIVREETALRNPTTGPAGDAPDVATSTVTTTAGSGDATATAGSAGSPRGSATTASAGSGRSSTRTRRAWRR
jgi:RNA polymerase sigma-70 factor, ECF subfamily